MLMGLLIAAGLVLLIVLLLNARSKQEARLREARQQTADILRTVKDGLFLLDEHLVIGTAHSSALESLFQRKDLAGLGFEELLKYRLGEDAGDRAQVRESALGGAHQREAGQIHQSAGRSRSAPRHGRGKFDTRYLDFEFHRVRVDGKITHVLVSVSDVSSRVELARELQNSQKQAQAQVDTLLGILHIDPAHLASFLSDSNAAMKMINAVLREPAREEGAFRKKLDTLFRQAHSVKGEAAALGLSSIESRAHSFEDDLKALREKSDLSGNDFLPLVIKLDDLLTHLQSVSELVSRLSKFQLFRSEAAASPTDTQVVDESRRSRVLWTPIQDSGRPCSSLPIGSPRSTARRRRYNAAGSTSCPRSIGASSRTSPSRPCATRSCTASSRLPCGSPRASRRRARCAWISGTSARATSSASRTTGRGSRPIGSRRSRCRRASSRAEQAENLDTKKMLSLLFQPGFSTLETATKDAGRGVGMNLMADLMRQIGGRVGVATAPGRYTRVTVTFPVPPKPVDDTVAA